MNSGADAEHITEKVNLRVDMKIIRTAAKLRDTWINFHTQKKESKMRRT